MTRPGTTGERVSTEWGHLRPFGKKEAAKCERKNVKKSIKNEKEDLQEASMNKKFINFLEGLKSNDNGMLIESVKKGFNVCYENEEDTGDIVYASFNHFELAMPKEAVADCYHQGQCDEDVAFWATKITRPESITPELLRTELKEYGAWDETELADDDANWNRIIWLAAGQIQDEKFESDKNKPESEPEATITEATIRETKIPELGNERKKIELTPQQLEILAWCVSEGYEDNASLRYGISQGFTPDMHTHPVGEDY